MRQAEAWRGSNAATTTKSSKSSGKKSNAMTADVKLHRRLNANLRSVVETYASTPAGWRRRPNTRRIDIDFGSSNNANNPSKGGNIDNEGGNSKELDAKLRAAFALRESKEHEQRDLVNATLKAENAKLRRSWGFSQVTTGGAGEELVRHRWRYLQECYHHWKNILFVRRDWMELQSN